MPRDRRGRPCKQWQGRFGEFVSSYRVSNLATELGVDIVAVYSWMRGEHQPSVDRAREIVELARRHGVELSLDDIYEVRL
jgi:hypothetical protein